MPRPATGSLLVGDESGDPTFAVRFRAYGKRRYVTLGSAADGWTEEKAWKELDRILADVKAGVWQPQAPTLSEIIRKIVDIAETDDPHEIASLVIAQADDDVIREELVSLVADAVKSVFHADRAAERNYLRDRYFVNGEWRRLGDCTHLDVRAISKDYDKQAAELSSKARNMRYLAEAMQIEGAEVVRDLRSDIAQNALRGKRTLRRPVAA